MGRHIRGVRERLESPEYRKIDGETGCWLWLKATDIRGKGRMRIAIPRRMFVSVPRLALMIYKGIPLESNYLACHKLECNNPNCFNPDHLYVGSASTNALDSVISGTHYRSNLRRFK